MLIRPCLFARPPELPDSLPTPPPLPEELANRPPPEPPPDLPDPAELMSQLKQLEELLSLPPEKLARLRQTIEFIEKMSEPEREAMRIRLVKVTRMTPELKTEIRRLEALVPAETASDVAQFWLAASPGERETHRQALEDLPESGKGDYLRDEVEAFIRHRERVFTEMRQSLEVRQTDGNPDP